MTKFKNWIIEWLGISHMAGDVYRKLLKEHEDRWERNARARQAETINQLQEMLRQHCADESTLRDAFAVAALESGAAPAQAYRLAEEMLYIRRRK